MAATPLRCLAIIPARGGSKGVPGKNIRMLDGKPLIAYAIEVAKETTAIHVCIVNTDSEEIADVARNFGATVFMRKPGQADDQSPVLPVIVDTLKEAEQLLGHAYDLVILLQTTSPLRTAEDINTVISMFEVDDKLEAVISVVDVGDHHPARMYRVDEHLFMHPLHPDLETARRQDLEKRYLRNGCVYAIKADVLREQQLLMPEHKKAYIMPAEWLANIDTERDFLFTEWLMKTWKQQTGKY